MGAPDLLRHLHEAGLSLRVEGGMLYVTPTKNVTPALRESIKQNKASLITAITSAPARRPGNPLMTVEQADDCHAEGWNDAEIANFNVRAAFLQRRNMETDAADNLAERLTLRDREGDDRHFCFECSRMSAAWRCSAGEVFLLDVLQRCGSFTPNLMLQEKNR